MKLHDVSLILNDNTLGGVETLAAEIATEHSDIRLITLYSNHVSKLKFGTRAHVLSTGKNKYLRQLINLCHLRPRGHMIGMLPRSYTLLFIASFYWRFFEPQIERRYSFLFASEKDLQNAIWKSVIIVLRKLGWGVIVLSESSRTVMEGLGFLPNQIVVLKNYIKFPEVPNKSEKFNYTVGYVGRLSAEKRYSQIFCSWHRVSVGDNSESPLNKNMVAYTGSDVATQKRDIHVEFKFSSCRYEIYSEVDILVLFSEFELEPGVIKEAMMSGCLIISTDVGLIKEMTLDYPIYFVKTEDELETKILEIKSWSLKTFQNNFEYARKKSKIYRDSLIFNKSVSAIIDA